MKTISNLERLKSVLQERDLMPTYQRLKILEYMDKHRDSHPTVEMIYSELSRKLPILSMTTIYNTLNAFLEKGLVSAMTITGTEIRYDININPHHHFLCRECGRIIDIDVECPFARGIEKAICGHRIEEVHGYFKGICKDCLKKAKGKIL